MSEGKSSHHSSSRGNTRQLQRGVREGTITHLKRLQRTRILNHARGIPAEGALANNYIRQCRAVFHVEVSIVLRETPLSDHHASQLVQSDQAEGTRFHERLIPDGNGAQLRQIYAMNPLEQHYSQAQGENRRRRRSHEPTAIGIALNLCISPQRTITPFNSSEGAE